MNAEEIIENIFDIYKKYDVPPTLQKHMIDVAAVGELISKKLNNTNTKNIVAALLLHDIANIIKFDLKGELSKKLGLESKEKHWLNVQKEFKEKYGNSCSIATKKIMEELEVDEHIIFLVETATFELATEIEESTDFELKVCLYSDYRVAPWGITTLKERFKDLKKRYHSNAEFCFDIKKAQELNKRYFDIEKQLFAKIDLKPEDITDNSIKEFLLSS